MKILEDLYHSLPEPRVSTLDNIIYGDVYSCELNKLMNYITEDDMNILCCKCKTCSECRQMYLQILDGGFDL